MPIAYLFRVKDSDRELVPTSVSGEFASFNYNNLQV